jgi:hypothetical protein
MRDHAKALEVRTDLHSPQGRRDKSCALRNDPHTAHQGPRCDVFSTMGFDEEETMLMKRSRSVCVKKFSSHRQSEVGVGLELLLEWDAVGVQPRPLINFGDQQFGIHDRSKAARLHHIEIYPGEIDSIRSIKSLCTSCTRRTCLRDEVKPSALFTLTCISHTGA